MVSALVLVNNRIIKDGSDYGCNYTLYSHSADETHSLLLASIDYRAINSNCHIKDSIRESNKGVLQKLNQSVFQNYSIKDMDTISVKSGTQSSSQSSSWSTIQRMTRLAESQHKVWVSLSLEPEFHNSINLSDLVDATNRYKLRMILFEVLSYMIIRV